MSSPFGAFVDFEPSSSSKETRPELHRAPTAPEKAVTKNYHSIALENAPDDVELDNLEWGVNISAKSGTGTPSGAQTPRTPNDLEMSRPVSPVLENQDGVDMVQSFSNPPMNRFRMLTVCMHNFQGGLSDSAPGALIIYMEKYYHIGYALVSLIFVTTAVGFILAAFFIDALRARVGRSRSMIIANATIITGYVVIICTPPFPLVVAAFFLLGIGAAMNLALGNVFAANLHNAGKMLGAMHGSYGMGGVLGPLIATAMVSKGLIWSRFYLVPLGITAFNLFFAAWSFWKYEAETSAPLLSPTTQSPAQAVSISRQLSEMLRAFKLKVVILGSLFIFAYQGAEVSISGWVISFLVNARGGSSTSIGYVTSGFWCGITLGRFFLSPMAHRLGEKRFVYGVTIGSAIFELLVWQVPNVIGDAVAVAIVGLLLGPIYPCAAVVFSRSMGRKDQVSGMSVISAFGSSGGAVAPFTTGLLAQASGAFVLHPIAISLFAAMMVCWFYIPDTRKRTE